MRKLFLIIGIIVILIIIFIVVNMFTRSGSNDSINKAFNPINFKCETDEDCIMEATSCNPTCGLRCRNKNWKPSCPFSETDIACKNPWDSNIGCKCSDNYCREYNTATGEYLI